MSISSTCSRSCGLLVTTDHDSNESLTGLEACDERCSNLSSPERCGKFEISVILGSFKPNFISVDYYSNMWGTPVHALSGIQYFDILGGRLRGNTDFHAIGKHESLKSGFSISHKFAEVLYHT